MKIYTVALCGGKASGDYVWMLDTADYATSRVSTREMWESRQEESSRRWLIWSAACPLRLLGWKGIGAGVLVALRSLIRRR